MNTPKLSILAGLLLCAIGVVGAIASAQHGGKMVTALIPFFLGDVLVALGMFALRRPDLRGRFMHGVALVALVGIPGGIIPMILRWNQASTLAVMSMALMALICAILLGLCVHTFMQARTLRRAERVTTV